jgi:hypothetical protein
MYHSLRPLWISLLLVLGLLAQPSAALPCGGHGAGPVVDEHTAHAAHHAADADIAAPATAGDCCDDGGQCPMQACLAGIALPGTALSLNLDTASAAPPMQAVLPVVALSARLQRPPIPA